MRSECDSSKYLHLWTFVFIRGTDVQSHTNTVATASLDMDSPNTGRAMPLGTAIGVVIVILIAMVSVGSFSVVTGSKITNFQDQVTSLQSQIRAQNSSQEEKINSLEREIVTLNSTLGKYAVNQLPIVRDVTLTWTKDLSLQDRFFGGPIVVNQGDTVRITFISNDTVAHTFTLGPPYDFQINASLPGLVNDLTLKTFATPATITVVVGVNNTVVWTNNDSVFHTVTATDRSFNSGTIFSGQTWSHTFTQPGTYSYYFCQYHPWMKGTLIVQGP